MSTAITCFGDELLTVCADLRQHGMVIDRLETGVEKRNSGYRVSYFERVGETEVRGTPLAGQTPDALTNLPVLAIADKAQEIAKETIHPRSDTCGTLAAGNSISIVTDGPSSLFSIENRMETPKIVS